MMTTIRLKTYIKAPIKEVFDVSRSIDFHLHSAKKTKEKAIAGITTGLIGLNETVTWRGKHFGIYLTHQSKITTFDSPNHFTDEMIKGHFKSFKHQHIFQNKDAGTEMTDILHYETPYGVCGKVFDKIILKKYLTTFLTSRNRSIKLYVEAKKLEK
ncbi:SRPBCC family protein [Aquimarina sp. 2304DJ70-9]|uniref:SRPBCC family protein n=1 Tax=Aquimarina penaris TaxID=3231044 RepID=UPI003461CCE9